MSITVRCDCGKSYSVDDKLEGKRIKCPSCTALLTIPLKEPDDDWLNDDSLGDPSLGDTGQGNRPPAHSTIPASQNRPRTQKATGAAATPRNQQTPAQMGNVLQKQVNAKLGAAGIKVPDGLPAVNKGIRLVFIGTLGSAILFLLGFLVAMILPQALFLLGPLRIACVVCNIVGFFFCLQVPPESKVKPLIFVVLAVSVLQIGLSSFSVISYFLTAFSIGNLVFIVLFFVSMAQVGCIVLFLLFIRGVAIWVKQPSIAAEAMLVIFLTIGLAVAQLLSTGITLAMLPSTTATAQDISGDSGIDDMKAKLDRGELSNKELKEYLNKRASTAKLNTSSVFVAIFSMGIGIVLFFTGIIVFIKYLLLLHSINFSMPIAATKMGRTRGWNAK